MTADGTISTNSFSGNATVGVQGQGNTIYGGVTIGLDTHPNTLFRVGVQHLLSGAPEEAREIIWDSLMKGYQGGDGPFYWLLAMLSGRTLKEFSSQEINRLKKMRARYTADTDDKWASGVRILSRLLDMAIPSLTAENPAPSRADLATLVKELHGLPLDQQDWIRPHLELFLAGPEQDALWKKGIDRAGEQRLAGDRPNRIWMYYQPIPKHVALPDPLPPLTRRRRLHTRAVLFAIAFCFFGGELMWHGALSGLAAFVVALTAGLAAAEADLRLRTAALRRRLEQVSRGVAGDQPLGGQVKTLFDRYFKKYEPDEERRQNFKNAFAERIGAECSEIIGLCRRRNASAAEVRWLIRHRACQLLRLWRQEALPYQRQFDPSSPRAATIRRAGLVLLILAGLWAVSTLRAYPLIDAIGTVAVTLGAIVTWRNWIADALEEARFQAEDERRDRRQRDIDEAFNRWSRRLALKPTDEEMGAWLAADRTILLDTALRHFGLKRSELVVHAFLEERAPWARAGYSDDGTAMYERYQILIFLLVHEGVRMVRASLDFVAGSFSIRERRDFRYDSIVAVRVTPLTGGREEFELQLTSGDPITLKTRGTGPVPASSPRTAPAEDEPPLHAASMASALHLLEGIAAEGQTWLTTRTWNRQPA